MQFKAFKPEAMNKIAKTMGYQGDMGQFQNFIEQDRERQKQMDMYTNAAKMMAQGGMVRKFKNGGSASSGIGGAVGGGGDGDGGLNPTFYRVPVGTPVDGTQETRKIYIGSEQDTRANRILGSSDLASAVQDAGPGFLRANPPYDERPDTQQAVQEQQPTQFTAPLQQLRYPGATDEQVAAKLAETMQKKQAAEQQASIQQAANLQNAGIIQPIYQAPYLSGTMFTPAGQYVQDPNTMQIIPQAYVPLNQGYGAAAANFQNVIQGVPQAPSLNPTVGRAIGFGADATQRMVGPVGVPSPIEPQKFAVGGTVTNPAGTQAATPVVTAPTQAPAGQPQIGQFSVEQMYTPGVPIGGTTIAAQTQTDPSQDIAAGTGTLTGQVAVPTATAAASQAQQITPSQANTMQAAQAAPAVDSAMQATQAAQANPQDPRAQVTAAQQTASSVGNLQAAQGQAQLINNPVQRQIQSGELITGTGVDATAAAAATAQTQAAAAQGNPSQQAMVQDQLAGLMTQFQGTNPPAWAAGAIRTANAQMAARGLGSSSLAGQAIVQAAMESALPIAQADARTVAQFDAQNLSNRQQASMLAAEQRAKFLGQEFDQAFQVRVQNAARVADVANQNFTADQQVQLENSRIANTMNLNNLSNNQALVMSEAAALAQLDVANLNSRQQSAVQNAQNFLQTDMANLSNRQQTDLFKAQQRIQSLFTDQAAQNASRQFNASSQNQVDQFFQQLGSQVSQFNATQSNAQAQYNAGQTNTVNRFNAELNNQRDQFNAQNQMVIAQANAQWRRQIATADTAAVNRANEINANNILDISKQAYSNLWNYYGDTMEWAWTSAENQVDRNNALAIAELDAKTRSQISAEQSSSDAGSALGSLIGSLGSAYLFSQGGGIFGSCWVAREVYGNNDIRWFVFRAWLKYEAPSWFEKLYMTHGEKYAKLISKVPPLKWATKKFMDLVVERKKGRLNVETV